MITREELFELVWTEPMTTAAKRFGVSDSYLSRVCYRLNVPRPARGYWAKLAVGKAPARPTLPEVLPGDEVSWEQGGTLPNVSRASPGVLVKLPRVQRRKSEAARDDQTHELIKGAKALFLNGRESRVGSYLKPAKRLLPEIHVTKAALDLALTFANALFKQLEQQGHRVTLASLGEQIHCPPIETRDKPDRTNPYIDLWSPSRRTVAYVKGTAIGIAIFELNESTRVRYFNGTYVKEEDFVAPKSKWSRDAHWGTTMDIPCGRLAVMAYASYYSEKWSRVWKEEKAGTFLSRIEKLAKEIASCDTEAVATVTRGKQAAAAEELRYEQMRRSWQEAQEKERLQKALAESKADLDQMLTSFQQMKQLEEFVEHIRAHQAILDPASQQKLTELISEARVLYKSGSCLQEFLAWTPPAERLKSF